MFPPVAVIFEGDVVFTGCPPPALPSVPKQSGH